jgi:hypothetical protein
MKLLTRLRELRNENTIDKLFDDFHFSVELNQSELMRHNEVMGIGTTTYEDIHRLSVQNNHFDKPSQPYLI